MRDQSSTRSRPGAAPARRGARSWLRAALGLLWIAPVAALTSVFVLLPLLVAALLSVRPGEHFDVTKPIAGGFTLDHYHDVFASLTASTFLVTATYVVVTVLASVGIGLWVALIVNVHFRGRGIAQAVLLLPWAIPGVVVSIAFLWILDQSFGVANFLLQESGLVNERIGWLTSPNYAMIGVLLPTIYKTFPLAAITLIAALKTIPKELHEAAAVDGASRIQRFRYVTLPGIRGSLALLIVILALMTYNNFDFIYALTTGGPLGSTETLAILIYNTAFSYFRLERAAALSILATVIAGVWVAIGFRWLRQEYF